MRKKSISPSERRPPTPARSGERLVGLRAGAALALGREQLEHEQAHADDDEAVGEVEVGPRVALPELEVEEVDHLVRILDAIDQVSDGATRDQAERERREPVPGGELAEERDDDREREQRDPDEEEQPPALRRLCEEAEGRSGIAHVGEVEEPLDHLDLVGEQEMAHDEPLGEEVEQQARGERGETDAELRNHLGTLPSGVAAPRARRSAQLLGAELAIRPYRWSQPARSLEERLGLCTVALPGRDGAPQTIEVRLGPGGALLAEEQRSLVE